MKLVPPRILKQLLQEKPPHNHHHIPNIPPRLLKLRQQEQPSFTRLIPPRLMNQQLVIRRSKLMMQEPIGMAIPHPQYPNQPMTVFSKHSPGLILQRLPLVQYYPMPRHFINFQVQDQEQNKEQEQHKEQEHLHLPLKLDESSVVDYARLTSFLHNQDDDSILTPWNCNLVHGHSTSANKRLQSGTNPYFSFNVREKWAH